MEQNSPSCSSTTLEESDTLYWIRWQVIVSALIIAIPFAMARTIILRLEDGQLRVSDLWRPCWRKVHPLWLLAYRCIATMTMSWLLYQTYLIYGSFAFYFYTTWTLMLLIAYFVIATVISAHGCWIHSELLVIRSEECNGILNCDVMQNEHATLTSKLKENSETIILQSQHEGKAGIWGQVMQIFYQASAGAVILTDVVFWGLLVPFLSDEHFSLDMIMYCLHSLNAIFLLLDTALNNLPFPWFRMAYFVVWSCIYAIIQWILHACGCTWPYPFLELSTPWAPVWYIGMAFVHIPCYGFYWIIEKAKKKLFPKFSPVHL